MSFQQFRCNLFTAYTHQIAPTVFLSKKVYTSISDDFLIDDAVMLKAGMELLSIRRSDIAITIRAKGPLLKKSEVYGGEIAVDSLQINQ